MIMKKHYIILLAGALILNSVSCDSNFEEINSNPDAIPHVTADLLLPTIIRGPVNEVMDEGWSIGNIVIQHTAKIQFVNEDRYLWGERNDIWSLYEDLRNVNNLYRISEESGFNNYKAIALIMKSWIFSLITDSYGDVPYSEAIKGKSDGLFQPIYDPQESIYDGILADLEAASELIGTSAEVVEGDILYGGNLENWKKLANSLRLRYLMRVSAKKDVSAEMTVIASDPAIFDSNSDNGTMEYLPSAPNQFPLHTARVGSFDEFRLSKTLGDQLMEYDDPRIRVFARHTIASVETGSPEYVGVPNGLSDVDALTYNGGPRNVSRIGALYYEDAISARGLQVAQGYIMAYPELQFILAEAALEGLIPGGNAAAEGYYEEGVRASFNYFDVEMPAGYLSRAGIAFNAAAAKEQIGTQKWIALFFSGLEGWFDWRRTNIPEIIPGPSNQNNDQVPVRFIYPLIEQSLNAANRNAAVERQGEDAINTKVWWDQ